MDEEQQSEAGKTAEGSFRKIGVPCVATARDRNSKVTQKFTCLRVGQLGLHENMLLILEGNYVSGVIRLGDLKQLHLEMRRSFKHPIVGGVIGAALIAAPVSVFVGDPFFLAGLFANCFAAPFFIGIGAYTLFEVVRSRQIPWLLAETASGISLHPLEKQLTLHERELLEAFNVVEAQPSSPS